MVEPLTAAWRRYMLSLMLSITFAGGALFGLLAASLGLNPAWWAPVVLVLSGAFGLFVGPWSRPGRGRP